MSFLEYLASHADDVYRATARHLELVGVSMLLAILSGLLLGLLVSLAPGGGVRRWVLNLTSAVQAVPSIAVVALAFLLIGIGPWPAILALWGYSLVPIVFNAVSGFESVPPRVLGAARGMGLNAFQVLLHVRLPMAIPVLMGGIRSAATINIGTATVAAVIGGGGLGDLIFTGLKLRNNEAILAGAVLSALLAVAIDGLLALVERQITSPGLRSRN